MKRFLLLFTFISLCACQNSSKNKGKNPKALNFAHQIEKAHHKTAFHKHEMVSFHLNLSFGGSPRMDAKISMKTNSSKIKIEKKDGTVLLYDGKKVHLSPKDKNYKQARFDMFTWAYFFGFPFKLTDPGTHWQNLKSRKLRGKPYQSAKLTFGNGIGDAPDDWYVVYADKKNHRLKAAAYIVTYGKDLKKAAKNPHAIVYNDYQTVDGVPIATHWTYYHWDKEKGIYGGAIGKATISEVHFSKANNKNFVVPKDAMEIEK